MQIYNYNYPNKLKNGSYDNGPSAYKLSAWSPSGKGNFHMPHYFGVAILDD
jgi:hypothetical protein